MVDDEKLITHLEVPNQLNLTDVSMNCGCVFILLIALMLFGWLVVAGIDWQPPR